MSVRRWRPANPAVTVVKASEQVAGYVTSMSWRRTRLRERVWELHKLLLAASVDFTFAFDDRMDCYTLKARLPDALFRTIRETF